ncbi:MAG: aromatic ring-hydroxylating dioxygenase subunit alpha [Pseudomonadota bacterium]
MTTLLHSDAVKEADALDALLAAQPYGRSLPGPLYHSRAAFALDLARIFRTQWLFACCAAEIPRPGDFITMSVGSDSIVVLRGDDGEARAFHNTCRHRGSKICLTARGSAPKLVCPYHQWTYGLDGRLVHAANMGEAFDPEAHGLSPVHVETLCGMVYVCLAETAPDFAAFRRDVEPYIAPHQPERTKVAHQSRIIEKANWKLVIENNRECYHCAANHPELTVSLVEFALPEEADDPEMQRLFAEKAALWEANGLPHEGVPRNPEYRCIRLPFDHGALSMTPDGGLASKMLLGDLVEPDLGSVRMFHVPNNWNHFLSDHILHFRALPISETETEVVTTWLVHEDAVEGLDYSVERLTKVWEATNEQDRVLAENNHLGTLSSAYRPGPYARTEFMVADFIDWYARTAQPRSGPRLIAAE